MCSSSRTRVRLASCSGAKSALAPSQRPGLGLTGRFVYIQVRIATLRRVPVLSWPLAARLTWLRGLAPLCAGALQLRVPAKKHCTIRLDVRTHTRQVVQLSFSGMYRDFKLVGTVARVPLR